MRVQDVREDLYEGKDHGSIWYGNVWANAMVAIGDALQRDVAMSTDCGSGVGFLEEMKSTKWRPRPDQLAESRLEGHAVPGRGNVDSDWEDEEGGRVQLVCCTVM